MQRHFTDSLGFSTLLAAEQMCLWTNHVQARTPEAKMCRTKQVYRPECVFMTTLPACGCLISASLVTVVAGWLAAKVQKRSLDRRDSMECIFGAIPSR